MLLRRLAENPGRKYSSGASCQSGLRFRVGFYFSGNVQNNPFVRKSPYVKLPFFFKRKRLTKEMPSVPHRFNHLSQRVTWSATKRHCTGTRGGPTSGHVESSAHRAGLDGSVVWQKWGADRARKDRQAGKKGSPGSVSAPQPQPPWERPVSPSTVCSLCFDSGIKGENT